MPASGRPASSTTVPCDVGAAGAVAVGGAPTAVVADALSLPDGAGIALPDVDGLGGLDGDPETGPAVGETEISCVGGLPDRPGPTAMATPTPMTAATAANPAPAAVSARRRRQES